MISQIALEEPKAVLTVLTGISAKSLANTLEKMFGIESEEVTKSDWDNLEGIVGLISFDGDYTWSLVLRFPPPTAEHIVSKFAGFEIEFERTNAGDIIGELTNAAPKLRLVELTSEIIEPTALAEMPETVEGLSNQLEDEILPPETDYTLLREFIIESRELIEAAEAALLTLENEPNDIEAINTVFRAFHTIKGLTAFIGLTKMTRLAHLAESLLNRIRDGEIRCTGIYADLSQRSIETLKKMLQSVENTRQGRPLTAPQSYTYLMEALSNPEKAFHKFAPILIQTVQSIKAQERSNPTAIIQKMVPKTATSNNFSVRVHTDRLDSLIDIIVELVITHSMLTQGVGELTSNLEETSAMSKLNAANVQQAKTLSEGAGNSVQCGWPSKVQPSGVVLQIKNASHSTSKIVKIIEELAFQANLLSLNAAVEAAIAGDGETDFAIVSDITETKIGDPPVFETYVQTDFLPEISNTNGRVRLLPDIERILSTQETIDIYTAASGLHPETKRN